MFVTFSTNNTNAFDGWEAQYYVSEVGINNHSLDNKDISVYPNPVGNLINLNLDSEIEGDLFVQIQNLNGQILSSSKFNDIKDGQTLKISTSDFASGLYIVSIKSSEFSIHRKILKN
jgi:hypothetical protein